MPQTNETKPTEEQIAAAVERLKAAQAAHAACLTWDYASRRFKPLVSDTELAAKYIASLEAERDYCALFGDTAGAEQIGYQIETAVEDLRRLKGGC
jgi:hypothetical protein